MCAGVQEKLEEKERRHKERAAKSYERNREKVIERGKKRYRDTLYAEAKADILREMEEKKKKEAKTDVSETDKAEPATTEDVLQVQPRKKDA